MTASTNRWSAPQPSILVVDGDEDTRAFYRHAFEGAGFHVNEASDGRDALVQALTRPPTLVVTEIAVPLLDGCALCEILRSDRTTTDVRILVITAETRQGDIKRVRRAGADIVLTKPTAIEPVLTAIRRLVYGLTAATEANRSGQSDPSAWRDNPGEQRHRVPLSHSVSRFFTTMPPASPPPLRCPTCGDSLKYERSHIGGVSIRHPEQWDYYVCPALCGTFEYRQRTRTVRRDS
jgi:CheY-like chemotaxis protein